MKKKIISLILIMMLVLLPQANIYALSIAKAGDTLIEEGEYDSLRVLAGNKVVNKANTDGLSLNLGNYIIFEGDTSYGLYAGNSITINGTIEKDLFVAGNNITISEEANIGRDVYIAGNNVKIKTNIKRDLRLASATVDLSGITINGDAYIGAENIILDKDTVITGKLTYTEDSKITNLELAKIGSTKTVKSTKVEINYTLKDRIYNFVISYCAALVTMFIIFYLIPKIKERLNNIPLDVESIAKTTGIGLLLLLITPLVLIIAIFSGVLTPISLITLAMYIISIYISTLLVGYIIGRKIINKYVVKDNTYLSLAAGILIIKLIKLIPVVGNIIGAIALLYGLGIIFKLIKQNK